MTSLFEDMMVGLNQIEVFLRGGGGAVLSDCCRYRYVLGRKWWADGRCCTWLMLNPSTADALNDDATIRKCVGFSRRWGYGRMLVINLFALRFRDPKRLVTAPDPVGPDYEQHLDAVIQYSSLVIAAWGCESTLRQGNLRERPKIVIDHILKLRPELPIVCLGASTRGTPYHPLMLSYDTLRVPFQVRPLI